MMSSNKLRHEQGEELPADDWTHWISEGDLSFLPWRKPRPWTILSQPGDSSQPSIVLEKERRRSHEGGSECEMMSLASSGLSTPRPIYSCPQQVVA